MSTNKNTALTFVANNSGSSSPTSPPNVTIISIDHYRISNKTGIDRSVVAFSFNTDVTNWSVNVLGVDPTSGRVASSGGAVPSGNQITATIIYTEVYQEGANRVNIYGQNSAGWTPYDNSGAKKPVFISPTQIILV